MLQRIAVGTAAAVLASISGIHLYWAAGGRAGAVAAVPEVDGRPAFEPGRNATLAVAGLLATASALYAAAAVQRQPRGIVRLGTAGVASVLLLRAAGDGRRVGFTKTRTGTRFADLDTRVYSPLCLALSLAGLTAVV